MKLFGRNQKKDNDKIEKPIVTYNAKYLGVLGNNKSSPTHEGAYVHIYEDRVDVELIKSNSKIVIPYKNMTDIQIVDAGKKVDLERVIGLGAMTAGTANIVDLLWKKHHIITIIKYADEALDNKTLAIDFLANTGYVQPIIDKKMLEVRNLQNQDTNQTKSSIADELSKLAKLKEQGVITEEEFSQMKNNLMRGNG